MSIHGISAAVDDLLDYIFGQRFEEGEYIVWADRIAIVTEVNHFTGRTHRLKLLFLDGKSFEPKNIKIELDAVQKLSTSEAIVWMYKHGMIEEGGSDDVYAGEG